MTRDCRHARGCALFDAYICIMLYMRRRFCDAPADEVAAELDFCPFRWKFKLPGLREIEIFYFSEKVSFML